MPIAVVTGTSTGIGFETALHLARNGWDVLATMRNLGKAESLRAAAADLPVEIVALDVTDSDAVDALFAGLPSVDVLVNNAGIGGATPLELVPEDEHRAMFDTNYFGAARCIQAVLPKMRAQGSGCIVNVTSIAGIFPSPNQIPYSASKFALEALGAALAHEVREFGIRVVNVEPGVIMTNIFDNSAEATRFDRESPYKQIMRRNGKIFASGFRNDTPPTLVAETILESIRSPEYTLRWPVGPDAQTMAKGIATMPIEEYIEMGRGVADTEYNAWFLERFGVQL